MSNLSLNGSLRTCKVEQGYAPRIQSDRFENPELMVCPVWSGFDNSNRAVCMDSFYTKSPGCNSPLDRVDVENYLRPQYMEYINLDAEGFRYNNTIKMGEHTEMSCTDPNSNMFCRGAGVRQINLDNLSHITGNFGGVASGADIQARSNNYPMEIAQGQMDAQKAKEHRQMQAMQHASQTQNMKGRAGMR